MKTIRIAFRSARFAILAAWLSTSACATVARVTNLDSESCKESFGGAIASALVAQGETRDEAKALAERAVSRTDLFSFGPRAFLIASHSGADYGFFVEKSGDRCVLRLFERQKGFVRYTNNLTYIESNDMSGCQCDE